VKPKHRHQPQGTVGSFNPKREESEVNSGVRRMLNQMDAARADPRIKKLQAALDCRDAVTTASLLPELKKLYGNDLWVLVKGTDRRR
jgi:hypothetical protein